MLCRSSRAFRMLLLLLLGWPLATTTSAQQGGYQVGDRVEVNRGDAWEPAEVVGGQGTRITVRFDGDDSLNHLSPEMRERRLTRTYYASRLRPARNETASPAASAPAAGSSAPSPASARPRTWSDASGRFSIEATYRGLNGEMVVLEKLDRSQIEVPLAKLSTADQEFVESQGGDPENPFAVAAALPAGYEPTMLRADKSGVQRITWRDFSEWSFKPEGQFHPASNQIPQKLRLSSLPDSKPFFEEIEHVDLTADGTRALVVRSAGDPGADDKLYLEIFDLQQGDRIALAALPNDSKMLAADLDTARIAYSEDESELVIAKIVADRLQTLSKWEPYADEKVAHHREVTSAWFLNDGRVMTEDNSGRSLTIWNPADAKALQQINIEFSAGDNEASLSADRRYLAVKRLTSIAIIDLAQNQHVANVELGELAQAPLASLAFSGSNDRLMVNSFNGLVVWDLATGNRMQGIEHTTFFPMHKTEWAGDFLFHANRYLYDLEHQVLLWELQGISWSSGETLIKGGVLCVVTEPQNGYGFLGTMPFPDAKMIALAEELGSPDQLIAAQAGDPVAIELTLDIDENVISEGDVRKAIAANLERAGYRVARKSKTVVHGICKELPTQTIKINTGPSRFMPRPEDIVERTITPHPTALIMTHNGIEVWRQNTMGQPHLTIWLEEGETLDDALTRITTPNIRLLTESVPPIPIIRPGTATENGAYGVTDLRTGASRSGRLD